MAQPTMQQVAERAGVSTRARLARDAAGTKCLGLPPPARPRRCGRVSATAPTSWLATGSRRQTQIGVVLNDIHNPFFAEIIDGIQAASDEAGYRVLIGNGKRSPIGRSGDGRNLSPVPSRRHHRCAAHDAIVRHIESRGTKCVVGRSEQRSKVIDSVNTDDVTGARLAVDICVELGHSSHRTHRRWHGSGRRSASDAATQQAMTGSWLSAEIVRAGGDFTESADTRGQRTALTSPADPPPSFGERPVARRRARPRRGGRSLRAGRRVHRRLRQHGTAARMHLSLTTVNQPRDELGAAGVQSF